MLALGAIRLVQEEQHSLQCWSQCCFLHCWLKGWPNPAPITHRLQSFSLAWTRETLPTQFWQRPNRQLWVFPWMAAMAHHSPPMWMSQPTREPCHQNAHGLGIKCVVPQSVILPDPTVSAKIHPNPTDSQPAKWCPPGWLHERNRNKLMVVNKTPLAAFPHSYSQTELRQMKSTASIWFCKAVWKVTTFCNQVLHERKEESVCVGWAMLMGCCGTRWESHHRHRHELCFLAYLSLSSSWVFDKLLSCQGDSFRWCERIITGGGGRKCFISTCVSC